MYTNPRNVVVFVDGVFKEVHCGLITPEIAGAYASGLMLGAGYSPAKIKLMAYVLPDDEDAMRKEQSHVEVERALDREALSIAANATGG